MSKWVNFGICSKTLVFRCSLSDHCMTTKTFSVCVCMCVLCVCVCVHVASFLGPAKLSVTCSMEKQETAWYLFSRDIRIERMVERV